MQIFMETLAALLAGAGLFLLVWMLAGRLLTPVGETGRAIVVVPAAGDADALEHDVKGLLWLRSSDFARFTVVIADCGLSEAGRAAARLLAQREQVELCPAEQVGALLGGSVRTATMP